MSLRLVLVLAAGFLGLSAWMALGQGISTTRANREHRAQLEETLSRLGDQLENEPKSFVTLEQLSALENRVSEIEGRGTEYTQDIRLGGIPLSQWIRENEPEYRGFQGDGVDLYSEIANDVILKALTVGVADPETTLPISDRIGFESIEESRREELFMKLLLVRHCLNAMAKSEIQALIRAEWGNPSKSHRFESNLEVTSFKWIVRAPETRIPEFLRFLALSPASPPYFSLRTIVVKPLPESIWSQVAHRFKNPPLDVEVTLELVKGRER